MGSTKLVISKCLKSGENAKYSYDKIGGVEISTYMYRKLKQNRKMKRLEKGKLLVSEILPHTIAEMKNQRENGASYSSIAKSFGLSWYLVQKALTNHKMV
jgi:hypothetical protein